jgi:hypothetical protein
MINHKTCKLKNWMKISNPKSNQRSNPRPIDPKPSNKNPKFGNIHKSAGLDPKWCVKFEELDEPQLRRIGG